MRTKIGLFGGTFNPVHFGHLRMALEVRQALKMDELRMVPCHRPPHRGEPDASSEQRAEMLRLALASCPELSLDLRELSRDEHSYSLDTLKSVRRELGPEVSITWVMGSDSFASLPSWHGWRELLDWGHILVVTRPESMAAETQPYSQALADWLASHQAPASALSERASGSVVMQTLRLLPISATDIRAQVAAGESPQFLLPDPVWYFIRRHGLYRAS